MDQLLRPNATRLWHSSSASTTPGGPCKESQKVQGAEFQGSFSSTSPSSLHVLLSPSRAARHVLHLSQEINQHSRDAHLAALLPEGTAELHGGMFLTGFKPGLLDGICLHSAHDVQPLWKELGWETGLWVDIKQ